MFPWGLGDELEKMKHSETGSTQVISESVGCYYGSDLTWLYPSAVSAPEPGTESSPKSH